MSVRHIVIETDLEPARDKHPTPWPHVRTHRDLPARTAHE